MPTVSFPSTSGWMLKAVRASLNHQYPTPDFLPFSDHNLKLSNIQSITEAQMRDKSESSLRLLNYYSEKDIKL
jgi:hypothetical protein